MKRKIVFVINYFYPDYASTGQLLTELCLELQHEFDITVIAVQPEGTNKTKRKKLFERDQLEEIKIIRLRAPAVDKTSKGSRIKFMLAYFVLAVVALFKMQKVDLIYTISSPPILGGLIGAIGKWMKRTKFIYNIQDFNPEQAEAISYSNKKWVFNLARKVDNISCRASNHIITVGKDMQETLIRRLQDNKVPNNSVINNWTDESEIIPLNHNHPRVAQFMKEHRLEQKFIVMYSGNLGLYYDLENIIKVTSEFNNDPRIVFVFIGEGAVKRKMEQYVKEQNISNVHFLPFQPKDEIKYSLNAAHVHLVVNQKGIKGVSVPSKIYGVMAAGKPIIGVLEEGSEAANLIYGSKCGAVVEPHHYEQLIRQIYEMSRMDEGALSHMGLNGRIYLEQNLTKQTSIDKYRAILQSI
ncbi:glycosyltransferase family 4 protein [Paenibacillus sediminis]|uniref:Glycosyltransferase involved in cell wall biosynthesis n=1 Tax=Paenibacillus sediminis TaxID=664909 RepID=A0ABS4H4D8_9BACL|nr:glycosyltransferase family 4 protein [Paenibacillus sediminis]MBP1937388.1 glycosyltransferase involved in cell wall biosynthesis [Paenibacillus sediminis]